MEGFAARLATHHATKSDIAELAKCARLFTRCRKKRDWQGMDQANVVFHDRIVELAGNDLLTNIMARFSIIRRAFKLAHKIPIDESKVKPPHPHEEVVKKMREGDAEGCGRLLESHILWAKDLIIKNLST